MTSQLVFSTQRYAYLRDDLVRTGPFDVGSIEVSTFPDGERYQRVSTPVSGRDVVLVGGTVSDADTLELYDVACSVVKYGARSLALVIPYFGYSTMERAVKTGEVVTAKTRARLFSAIPLADAGNRVFLVDLHAEGIPHYFEGGIRPVHVYAKPVIVDLARRFGGDDMVLACTDAGRAKWVESLANEMGVPASFVFKRRLDGSHTEVTAMSAAVAGKSVVIYDDMIRTGGSLISAARAYKSAGAVKLTAITTHGVFPGDALERLRETGLFSAIACTDTHPRAREFAGASLHVAPIASVLARALEENP
jgi:ribose-phosphate pyrophosphokinase